MMDKREPAQTRLSEDDLRWDHYRCGGGVGSISLTHLPTGITMSRDCRDTAIVQIHRQLRSELESRLAGNAPPNARDGLRQDIFLQSWRRP